MGNCISKCAIITGVYGQDGSLLAEYLLGLGYRVVGLVKERKLTRGVMDVVEIIETDISDPIAMNNIFAVVRPDECYHLAAHHHSSEEHASNDGHWQMLRVNLIATQAIIDSLLENVPTCRFLYAGSSQMFTAREGTTKIDEATPFSPSTYYGITKVASAQLIENFRRERGLWGLTTILFNHESTRRGSRFLSRKVTSSAAAFKVHGPKVMPKIELRDLAACTDWSAASDLVRAMHSALQVQNAQDYVLASGKSHTVSDLVREAFAVVDLDWREFIITKDVDTTDLRPCLIGDTKRAQRELDWSAKKSFRELVKEMVLYDLMAAEGTNV